MNASIEHKDHRDLIVAYDLGHIEEHSPGLIHWHPNGQKVLNKLKAIVRDCHEKHDYQEVSSPLMLHRSLWEKSGHWDKYQSHMFVAQGGDDEIGSYAIKPMSCPGHIAIYQSARRSYRELPYKLFEFGHVHRNEASGALSGWMRLRGFVQDDSHVFVQPENISQVIGNFAQMVNELYKKFGFSEWKWKLSLRPDVRAGSDELWDVAEQALKDACYENNINPSIALGDGAFYGPKLEAVLVDRLGREWQCGVAQMDFVLPERFGLKYQDANGDLVQPVMIHHAVLGSLERWISIVMEHHGELPMFLNPCPVAIFPIGERHQDYCQKLSLKLKKSGVLNKVFNDGPLNGRLRQADGLLIPYRLVVGDREISNKEVAIRVNHEGSKQCSFEDAIKIIGNLFNMD